MCIWSGAIRVSAKLRGASEKDLEKPASAEPAKNLPTRRFNISYERFKRKLTTDALYPSDQGKRNMAESSNLPLHDST